MESSLSSPDGRAIPNPHSALSDKEKLEKRKTLFEEILQLEVDFVNDLDIFIQVIVNQFMVRDTTFKRNFLNEPSIAVSFNLIKDIHSATFAFLESLQQANSGEKLAQSYLKFSPQLQLFAQYVSENIQCLNAVKSFHRQLKQFSEESSDNVLPDNMTVDSCLVLPLNHYSNYLNKFQEFVWLTPTTKPEYNALNEALDSLSAQTAHVDETITAIAESIKLLALQNQFVGNPRIFTTTRRILREGEIERYRMSKGVLAPKTTYFHLLSDALIYSQRNNFGYFKLTRAIDLGGATLALTTVPGYSNTFTIKDSSGEEETLGCAKSEDMDSWYSDIEQAINSLKTKRADRRATNLTTGSSLVLPSPEGLSVRSEAIFRFISSEIRNAELVAGLYAVAVKPMIDASKKALLHAGELPNAEEAQNGASLGNKALFDDSVASASRVQAQSITEALQAANVQLFLRAAEGLATGLRDFVESLRQQCATADWADSVCIGSFFTSASARSLYSQYKSYASEQQGMERILRGNLFAQFYQDVEKVLGPLGTLSEVLVAPRNRPEQYYTFFEKLASLTPASHPDSAAVLASLETLKTVSTEVETVIRDKKNFEKLLDIQASFVITGSTFGTNSNVVSRLASTERTFICEGDLNKVCRKAVKKYRFWLFNDYLIYGSSLGSNSYTFHRALDLHTCSVAEHKGAEKNAFEIFGAEKSFIVIAPSQSVQGDWIAKVKKAKEALHEASGTTASEAVVAPVWVPDKGSDACSVCKSAFSMFKRRHHCRKCGALVCGDHSNKKEVLPHIHKTEKQRVCDNCFGSGPPLTVANTNAANAAKDSAAASVAAANVPGFEKFVPRVTAVAAKTPGSEEALAAAAPLSPTGGPPPIPGTAPPTRPISSNLNPASPVPPPKPMKKPPPRPVITNPEAAVANPAAVSPVSPTVPKPAKRAPPPPRPVGDAPTDDVENLTLHTPPPPVPVAEVPRTPPPLPPMPASEAVVEDAAPRAPPPPARKGPPPPPMTPVQAAEADQPAPAAPAAPTSPRPPPPPAPPRRQSDAEESSPRPAPPAPPAPPAARPPPPAPPASQATVSPPVGEGEGEDPFAADPRFATYIRMKKMLPEGAVRQKMQSDGIVSFDEIDAFFGGKGDTPIRTAPLKLPTPTVKPPAPALSPTSPSGKPGSLLEAIQAGPKLKAVVKDMTKPAPVSSAARAGGMLSLLSAAMDQRRNFVKDMSDNDDSDSDGGFSDSDVDSD